MIIFGVFFLNKVYEEYEYLEFIYEKNFLLINVV